jgi:hypothetical protein
LPCQCFPPLRGSILGGCGGWATDDALMMPLINNSKYCQKRLQAGSGWVLSLIIFK